MPDQTFVSDPSAVLVVLACIVFAALQFERRFPLGRNLGAALVGILLGMALSNSGILPGESPVYVFLQSTAVDLGIVLILTSVDVGSVLKSGPSMLAAFGVGTLGTAVGATISGLVLYRQIGPETWKLSGQFTGTYTGGGMNFAALGRAFDTSSDLFTAAIAADVILTAIWMAVCLSVPVLLGKKREAVPAASRQPEGKAPMTLEKSLQSSGREIVLTDLAALVALSVSVVLAAPRLEQLVPLVPAVLWLTSLSLVVGQVPAIRRLSGGAMVGNYLVLLFLASNGAQSVVQNIVNVGPAVFYFACITVAVHGVFVFGGGRLLGLDLGTLAVASQANVGGAASAVAMATARGYGDRLLPGVAVGLLGYAVGNYLGFGVASLMRSLLS